MTFVTPPVKIRAVQINETFTAFKILETYQSQWIRFPLCNLLFHLMKKKNLYVTGSNIAPVFTRIYMYLEF